MIVTIWNQAINSRVVGLMNLTLREAQSDLYHNDLGALFELLRRHESFRSNLHIVDIRLIAEGNVYNSEPFEEAIEIYYKNTNQLFLKIKRN